MQEERPCEAKLRKIAPAVFCDGNKVCLRAIQTEDVPLIVKWKNDPFVRRMAVGRETQITLENQQDDVKKAIESDNELYLIIMVKETDQAVGYVRVNWIDQTKRFAWLRFALGEQRGRGYAKDALKALLAHLFSRGVHRAEAEVYEFNEPSFGLLESLGFKKEGTKREAHFDGAHYADVLVLGLLKEEFQFH
jgi:RimJ/RimL family protein N-acetyltransferase